MSRRMLVPVAATAALFSLAAAASAQQPRPKATHAAHETEAQLQKETKISKDSARAIAMREVPNGRIESSELEREHGKLIYSFDIRVAGKSGIEEINVDAKTGALVAHEHESPKAEKAEARKEAKEKRAKP